MAAVSTTDRSPSLLTADEVAEILRVSPRTVRRLSACGRLPRVQVSQRLTRYTAESIEALINSSNNSESPADTELPQEGRDAPRDTTDYAD